MSDLIRRDDAMQAIADYEFPWCKDSEPVHLVYGMGTAMKIVENIPAVDAVEVIVCEKCKHWDPMDKGLFMTKGRIDGACEKLLNIHDAYCYLTPKYHYCGYGERREENATQSEKQ